ncbi:MAG: alpha/beta fold hydrolase [Acidobacteriota bacterium]
MSSSLLSPSVGYGDGGFDWNEGRGLAVLLHGAGGDRSSWALQARTLGSDGWNVLAVDFPGHGRSAQLGGDASIEALADWVGETVETVPAPYRRRLCVAGHSMGACVAVTLAARRDVDRLALLGAGKAMPVNDALLHDTLHAPQQAARFIAAFAHAKQHHLGGAEMPGVWLLGATAAQIARTDPEILHADFAACNAWRSEDLLESVTAPTLVVVGDADRMTPPAAGIGLADSLGDSTLETLTGVGHMMMLEAPTTVGQLLRRHFGDAHATG